MDTEALMAAAHTAEGLEGKSTALAPNLEGSDSYEVPVRPKGQNFLESMWVSEVSDFCKDNPLNIDRIQFHLGSAFGECL